LLEQEKSDLESTVSVLQGQLSGAQARPPSSLEGLEAKLEGDQDSSQAFKPISPAGGSSEGPESLPRLPGLPVLPGSGPLSGAGQGLSLSLMQPLMPGLGVLGSQPTSPPGMFPGLGVGVPGVPLGGMHPGIMDSRPPPLGRMSPQPRDRHSNRSFDSRSPSPQYDDRYGRETRRYGGRSERGHSPSTRSERRSSPGRRPSPTRSERGGGRYRQEPRDRHSPDRYTNRGERERGSGHTPYSSRRPQQDYLSDPQSLRGPKTSSPMEPQQVRNYGP